MRPEYFVGRCTSCNGQIWHEPWEGRTNVKNGDPDCEHFHPDMPEDEYPTPYEWSKFIKSLREGGKL